MRLLSLIATMVATAAIAIYAMTCSVNNVPPAPVHPIVGKWQQVVLCGRQVKPGAGMIVEIQSNKEIVYSMRDRAGNWSHEHGTYDIVGTAMYVCIPSRQSKCSHTVDFILAENGNIQTINISIGDEEEFVRISK